MLFDAKVQRNQRRPFLEEKGMVKPLKIIAFKS